MERNPEDATEITWMDGNGSENESRRVGHVEMVVPVRVSVRWGPAKRWDSSGPRGSAPDVEKGRAARWRKCRVDVAAGRAKVTLVFPYIVRTDRASRRRIVDGMTRSALDKLREKFERRVRAR